MKRNRDFYTIWTMASTMKKVSLLAGVLFVATLILTQIQSPYWMRFMAALGTYTLVVVIGVWLQLGEPEPVAAEPQPTEPQPSEEELALQDIVLALPRSLWKSSGVVNNLNAEKATFTLTHKGCTATLTRYSFSYKGLWMPNTPAMRNLFDVLRVAEIALVQANKKVYLDELRSLAEPTKSGHGSRPNCY